MHTGYVITGIILLIVAIPTTAYIQSILAEYQTLLGQRARILSPDINQQYQAYQLLQVVMIIVSVMGAGFLILGAFKKEEDERRAETAATDTNTVFCRYCGRLRPASEDLRPMCGKSSMPTSDYRKECMYCNITMSADSEFFGNCGRRL
jgi:hypothetical protein